MRLAAKFISPWSTGWLDQSRLFENCERDRGSLGSTAAML